jgi:hypothetical protein
MASHRRSDFGAALTGLVVGGCLVYAIVFAVVQLTNLKFAGHAESAEKAATESTK